jgi:hypothetical protein
MLTDTGAQKAGGIVGYLAKLLLDGLIDHGSTGNVGFHRLAAGVIAIATQHTGQHFRQSALTLFTTALRSAFLLAGLGSLLSRLVLLGKPIGTWLVLLASLFLLTSLVLSRLGTAFLALGLGCRGFLLLLFASTGRLILSLLFSTLVFACVWSLTVFRFIRGF